mmetsp:Transcript_11197/g.9913  ORF Transcript_11197/g.9913 Transcript_11197/m.9913 type:complete len:90 (-) Transcript_11197:997-1266(-)
MISVLRIEFLMVQILIKFTVFTGFVFNIPLDYFNIFSQKVLALFSSKYKNKHTCSIILDIIFLIPFGLFTATYLYFYHLIIYTIADHKS